MLENLTASVLTAFLPQLTYQVPVLGQYDFTQIVSAGIVFIALTIAFWLLRTVILLRLKNLAAKTTGTFDDMLVGAVQRIKAWVYTLVSLYIALQFFTFPETIDLIFRGIFYFVVVLQAIAIASCFLEYVTANYLEKDEDGDGELDAGSVTASNMVTLIGKIVMWVFGTIFVLSNLGIEVTSLIAGLGVGGIAVAFALQGILGDLFASFSIYFDKPFRIGDYIVIGNDSGTVEKIGVKTTRIRTLQGEELVVSNAELTTARVQNFKKMAERRIVSQFGITYETAQEKVRQVPEVVENIFAEIDGARLDRVHFTTFADSALIFEIVYYIDTSDYTVYLDRQQQFNFQLMKIFADMDIEFAYPTQTIYTKTVN